MELKHIIAARLYTTLANYNRKISQTTKKRRALINNAAIFGTPRQRIKARRIFHLIQTKPNPAFDIIRKGIVHFLLNLPIEPLQKPITKNKMETLEITKANAVSAYKSADDKGKTLLSKLFGEKIFSQKITDRIKTIEDACEDLGINALDITNLTKDEISYKKLKIIAKSLNEGWEPNWNNSDEYKYYPYFDMRSGVGFSDSHCADWNANTGCGSRLCFKSRELAEYAGKQFLEIYKDYLTL